MEALLNDLRKSGWRVAVHNDYRFKGQDMTFWLLTHECGVYIKGEGLTDLDALKECEKIARRVFRPSP